MPFILSNAVVLDFAQNVQIFTWLCFANTLRINIMMSGIVKGEGVIFPHHKVYYS